MWINGFMIYDGLPYSNINMQIWDVNVFLAVSILFKVIGGAAILYVKWDYTMACRSQWLFTVVEGTRVLSGKAWGYSGPGMFALRNLDLYLSSLSLFGLSFLFIRRKKIQKTLSLSLSHTAFSAVMLELTLVTFSPPVLLHAWLLNRANLTF